MTDDDEKRLLVRLTALAELFGKTLTRSALHGYCRSLRDLALSSVEHAIARCERECARFPTPFDIRSRLGSDGTKPTRPAQPRIEHLRPAVDGEESDSPLTRVSMARILRDVADRDTRGEYSQGGARSRGSRCPGTGRVGWMRDLADSIDRREHAKRTGNPFADAFGDLADRVADREPGSDDV